MTAIYNELDQLNTVFPMTRQQAHELAHVTRSTYAQVVLFFEQARPRWTPNRRLLLLKAIDHHLITERAARDLYDLNFGEIASWRQKVSPQGLRLSSPVF